MIFLLLAQRIHFYPPTFKRAGSHPVWETFPGAMGVRSRDTGKGSRYAYISTMNSQTLSGQTNQSLPLAFALVFQIALISLTVGLFSVSIPISYEQRLRLCGAEPLQSNSQRPDALSGGP